MNWMGLADCYALVLSPKIHLLFLLFPAERHRTFGTLFRSKSQQNWIFGKSKARKNFTHVSVLFFYFLEDYGPSKQHLEQKGWYIKNAANVLSLNLLTWMAYWLFETFSDKIVWDLLPGLCGALRGGDGDHNGDPYESTSNFTRMCLPGLHPDLHVLCWILWSYHDSPRW